MLGLGMSSSGGGSGFLKSLSENANTNSYSISLDGANDYLSQPDGDNIFVDLNRTNWSLSFYVNLANLNSFIFWKGNYFTSSYLTISSSAGGDLKIWGADSGTVTISTEWNTNLSDSTWYHIVITSSGVGTNRVNNCYVNGVAQTSNSHTSVLSSTAIETPTGSEILRVGALYSLVHYEMLIDQVATWGEVLSASSVLEVYSSNPNLSSNSGNYTNAGRLQRYFKMEAGSGTSANDIAGNAFSAMTLVNGPVWSTNKPW